MSLKAPTGKQNFPALLFIISGTGLILSGAVTLNGVAVLAGIISWFIAGGLTRED